MVHCGPPPSTIGDEILANLVQLMPLVTTPTEDLAAAGSASGGTRHEDVQKAMAECVSELLRHTERCNLGQLAGVLVELLKVSCGFGPFAGATGLDSI